MHNHGMRYLFLVLFLVSACFDLQAASSRRLFSRSNFTKEAIMRDVKSPKAWAKAFMPVFLLMSFDLLNNWGSIDSKADFIAIKATIVNDVMNSLKNDDYQAEINRLKGIYIVDNKSDLHPCYPKWMGGKQSLIELLHKKGLVFETNEVIHDLKKMNAFVKTIVVNIPRENLFYIEHLDYRIQFDKTDRACSEVSFDEKSILGKVVLDDKSILGTNLLGTVYSLIGKSINKNKQKGPYINWPNATIRQRLIGYIQYRFGLMSTSF